MHAAHQPFLEMIREHPRDDAPRLIYADWLDEQGDPRGEFIRIQCELAKIPSQEIASLHRLENREQYLQLKHWKEWTRSLQAFQVREAKFRRGFLEEAKLIYRPERFETSPQFAKHWKSLLEHEPALERVGLFFYRDWNEIKPLDHAPQIRELHFTHQRLTRREVSIVLHWPIVRGLSGLDLSHNNLRSGVECVAQAPELGSLEMLDLSFNSIGSRGARALASSSYLQGVQRLNLRGNHIGREGKQKLRAAFGARVEL